MKEFWIASTAAVPVFLLMGTGAVFRWRGWWKPEADATLFRLIVNLLMPCLILDKVVGNPAFLQHGNTVLPPLVGFGTIAIGLLVSWSVRGLARLPDERSRRTFAFTTGMYNYSYIPYPLAVALFDSSTTGVLFVHNLGVEVAMWTVGLMAMGGAASQSAWRNLINGPVLAIVAAVALNMMGISPGPDHVLRATAHLLGVAAVPLGLLQIGAIMQSHAAELRQGRGHRDGLLSCIVRLGVLPIVFLLLARALPLPAELRKVMILQAAMPCAVFPIVMAGRYGGDGVVAVRVVLITSMVGFFTMPFWIRFGLKFVGLEAG